MYFLSKRLLEKIEAERPNGIIAMLAIELKVSSLSINRFIRENAEDNDLTKAVALTFFHKEFGMTNEQILSKTRPVLEKKAVASTE